MTQQPTVPPVSHAPTSDPRSFKKARWALAGLALHRAAELSSHPRAGEEFLFHLPTPATKKLEITGTRNDPRRSEGRSLLKFIGNA
jgi:hypothetical protein